MSTLEGQIHKSIATTMSGSPTEKHVDNLAAFLRSLKAPPAISNPSQESSVARGESVFQKHGCIKCHEPPTFTSPRVYELPLADESGHSRFNPPSLRGISQRTAFFHDNRARTLGAVFTTVRHGVSEPLKDGELSDLLSFLATL